MNTKAYLEIKEKIALADAVVIGAGAGLSTSAGVNYGPINFAKNFPELASIYGFTDMYTSSFYEFETEEERWSYWAKHINYLCLSMSATPTYQKLYDLVKDKNYFVITTNVDRQFIKSGFDSKKVFEVQGSLTKIQCARACHNKLYDDTKMVKDMLQENKVNKIPTNLIPKCPVCGGKMEVNLRKDFFFVEDDYWEEHNDAYVKFLKSYQDKKILFLELGVGFNTPGIIRYPFEELTKKYPKAFLIRMNDSEAGVPFDIKSKSLEIKGDINKILESGDDVERKSNV